MMMNVKKKFITITLTIICCFSLLFGLFGIATSVKAEENDETQGTQAYFVGMDDKTQGYWYDVGGATTYEGYKDKKSLRAEDGTMPDNRKYGKEGLMLLFTKLTGDGKGNVASLDQTDFTENSDLHYIEYPTYVDYIKPDEITSLDDWWCNREDNTSWHKHDPPLDRDILSPDPSRWNRKGCVLSDRGMQDSVMFHVGFNDDEWHTVSIYIAAFINKYYVTGSYAYIQILSDTGEVLAQARATEWTTGQYFRFNVKGSFSFNIERAGGAAAPLSALFFDPLMSEEEQSKTEKIELTAECVSPKTVNLSWKNGEDAVNTLIWRKEAKEKYYSLLATVDPLLTGYTDNDTKTGKVYSYRLGAAKESASYPNVFEYSAWSDDIVSQATEVYPLTRIEFDDSDYFTRIGNKLLIGATVYTDVVYDENDDTVVVDGGKPLVGALVTAKLCGDETQVFKDGKYVEVINEFVGECLSDENGRVVIECSPYYGGTYDFTLTINDSIIIGDKTNSYVGCENKVPAIIAEEDDESAPVLFTISDAIKPGDSVSLMGNFIESGNAFKLAYAPHVKGVVDPEFDTEIAGLKYLYEDDVQVIDDTFNTGIMLIFPEDEDAGVYDFWLRNSHGWSNCITMNRPRPLFVSQEAAYPGLDLEISGRNYYGSEFGLSDEFVKDIKIKLENVATGNSTVVEPKFGVRFKAKDGDLVAGDISADGYSATGEDVPYTQKYKLTFTVPEVAAGDYKIYVANDGESFYELSDTEQIIKIYAKKAANYSSSVYGTNVGVGNDPLNLGVYWAQDMRWDNVYTVDEEFRRETNDITDEAEAIKLGQKTVTKLNSVIESMAKTGGVIYFPKGYYYIRENLKLASGIALVGDSEEDTHILITLKKENDRIRRVFDGVGKSNVGMARMSLTLSDMGEDRNNDTAYIVSVIDFSFSDQTWSSNPLDHNMYRDQALKDTQNKFIVHVKADFPRFYPNNDGLDHSIEIPQPYQMSLQGVKNFILTNVYTKSPTPIGVGSWKYSIVNCVEVYADGFSWPIGYKYTFVENNYADGNYNGHGFNGRSHAYMAYNYITKTGKKGVNQGEIFLFEPPSTLQSWGQVLGATSNTVTLKVDGGTDGQFLESDTNVSYNWFSIYIRDGKGAGQMRYIERVPIAGKDGVYTGFSYKLCDWEKPWTVIPDSTSTFTVSCPMHNNTFYKNSACDNQSSICLYGYQIDNLVAENTLIDTGGICLSGIDNVSNSKTIWFNRIENNYIQGASHGDLGLERGAGAATGIMVQGSRQTGTEFRGVITAFCTIRNNVICDIKKGTATEENLAGYYAIKLSGNDALTSGDMRYIIVENNVIRNVDINGISVFKNVLGAILRNNTIEEVEGEELTITSPKNCVVYSDIEFFDGEEKLSGLSGTYKMDDDLPTLTDRNGKAFWGWSRNQTVSAGDEALTKAEGYNAKLYAIYGRKVDLKYNYDERDSYKTYVLLDGESLGSLGKPVRVGYNFDGWYYDQACTEAYEEGNEPQGNLTLYAKWSAKSQQNNTNGSTATNNAAYVWLYIVLPSVIVCGVIAAIIVFGILKTKKQ